MMRRIEREPKGSLRPGQDLVVAGYPGREGARRIAAAREKELLAWFSKEYIEAMQRADEITVNDDAVPWQSLGAAEWEEVGQGGIYTALWNLSGAYRTGFEVDLRRIPVRQETIEICERYDLNPYRLLSSNCMVAAADNGGRLAEELSRLGLPAAVIGRVNEGIKREICYGQVRGFMERPREDEVYRGLGIVREEDHNLIQHENLRRKGLAGII